MPPKSSYVLDTSALLTLRGDEPGANRIESLLSQATKNQCQLLISFMTRMELLHLLSRHEGESAARDALLLIDSFPAKWISCEPRILEAAAAIKARGKLSVADSWIAATAAVYGATLIHKDPEFKSLKEMGQEAIK